MKKIFRNILILISPYLIMLLVNEGVRPTINELGFERTITYSNFKSTNIAINPELKTHDVCSWRCHNSGCKPQLFKSIENYISPIYSGIISFLKSGGSFGSYALANILFLVLIWPLAIFYLFTKSIDMHQEIKEINKKLKNKK